MKRRSRSILVMLVFLGVVLAIIGLTYGNWFLADKTQAGKQFAASWAGANLWIKEGISPYDDRVGDWVNPSNKRMGKDFIIAHLGLTIPIEKTGSPLEFRKGLDFDYYIYPMTTMLVTVPFGLLDFFIARAIWMTVLEVSLVLLVLASIRLTHWEIGWFQTVILIFFCLFWYYGVQTIIEGQIGILSALFATLSLIFILQNQDIPAGVFLALSTIKPPMIFLLVPFLLLWALSVRRRDVVWSFLITVAVAFLGTLVLIPTWPIQWLQRLFQFTTSTSQLSSPLMLIADSMPGIFLPVAIFFHGIFFVYLIIEWFLAMGKDEQWFLWASMLTIVVTNLGGYKTATTNYALLIPALFLILQSLESRWRVGRRFISGFVLLLMGVGIWALIYATGQLLEMPMWVYFPLPLVCLIGLWWVRWWFIRPQKLYIETLAQKIR